MASDPDPYADLPVDLRRRNLLTHREALLSDRMAAELHARRLDFHEAPDAGDAVRKVDRIDQLLADVDRDLAALPEG